MRKRRRISFIVPAILALIVGLASGVVLAENIDPNTDGSQYAYGENAGWINFQPSFGPGVTVTDSAVTGFAWGENIGWVSLSCENTSSCATVDYGVVNNGFGELSGFAWAENAGWISLFCGNTSSCGTVDYGVTIDPVTGEFSGRAWGENIGWISFDSTGPVAFGIATSWRPAAPPQVEGDLDGDSDVDFDDLAIVTGCFGQIVADNPECAIADVNGDGVVNILDVSIVASNFS